MPFPAKCAAVVCGNLLKISLSENGKASANLLPAGSEDGTAHPCAPNNSALVANRLRPIEYIIAFVVSGGQLAEIVVNVGL